MNSLAHLSGTPSYSLHHADLYSLKLLASWEDVIAERWCCRLEIFTTYIALHALIPIPV
jgi:hypothetical protein